MKTVLSQSHAFTQELYQSDNLQEWIELFLHSCRSRNLASGTIGFYIKKLGAFLVFCSDLAITEVGQITPEIIRHFLIYLEERHHKPGGIHCYYRALKTFLKWYEEEVERADWSNPIERVKAPFIPLEPLDPVSIDTIRAMIDAEGQSNLLNLRDKAILLFFLDTGVRLAELLGLNKEDVNLITGAVQIRNGKGRKPRNVYMGEKTRKAVKRYLKERRDYSPALWINSTGDRLVESGLRMMLRRRAERAGVPAPAPHDFRRAFALERWRTGMDPITISKLMGHTSLQVLTRYMKQAGEDLEQAARQSSPVDLRF